MQGCHGRTAMRVELPRAVRASWVSLLESSCHLRPSSAADRIPGFAWFMKTATNDISFLEDPRSGLPTLDKVVSSALWGGGGLLPCSLECAQLRRWVSIRRLFCPGLALPAVQQASLKQEPGCVQEEALLGRRYAPKRVTELFLISV